MRFRDMNAQVAFNDIVRDLFYSDMKTDPSQDVPPGEVEQTPTGLKHSHSPENPNIDADSEITSWLRRIK